MNNNLPLSMLEESNLHPHAPGETEESKHLLKVETNSATASESMEPPPPCARSPRSLRHITLSMLISVEGTTVHPDCKHAFSPADGRKMYQKCKNASKSSHKGVGKYKKKKKWGKKHSKESRPELGDAVETSSCMRSPMRRPAKFVLSMFNLADGRNEHHKCRHASNPYHKCNETCIGTMNVEKNGSRGSSPDYCIWSPMEDKASERTAKSYPMGSPSPYRENVVDRIRSPTRFLLSMFDSADGSNAKKCAYASNPYHKCGKTCIMEMEELKKGNNGSGPGPETEQSDAHTPFQEHKKSHTRPPRFSANWLVSMFHSADGSEVHNQCKYSSNPYHKCSEKCTPTKPSGKKGISKGLKPAADTHDNCDGGGTRNVHPQCKYASSPYHNRCTEKCMQRINGGREESKREGSVNEGKAMEGGLAAQPDSLQSSNLPQKSIGDSEFIDEAGSNQSVQHCEEGALTTTVPVEESKEKEKLKRSTSSDLIDALLPCMEKFLLDSLQEVSTVCQDVALPFSTVDEEKQSEKDISGLSS